MIWSDFNIIGFAPDLPQNNPGLIWEQATPAAQYSYGFYPTLAGFRNGPWPEIVSTTGGTSGAIDTTALTSAVVYKTDGSFRLWVGTAAKLWEYNGGTTITDRSDTAYSASTTNTWSFCQFGDITLAANLGDRLRQIAGGAAFASVGAAPVPKASIIVTCGPTSAPFVMAFDYDDGTNQYRDGWFNSGLSDATSGVAAWTTGTNGCANGRLLDDLPGPITAAIAYRDGVIAWKPSGMYLGSYDTQLSAAWSWQRISRDIGCLGKNCAVNIEDTVYFADEKGIWTYDGSYPKRVPGAVHKWWATAIRANSGAIAGRNNCKLVWDRFRRNLWCLFPVSSKNTTGAVYSLDSQRWAPWSGFVNAAATVNAQQVICFGIENQTFDGFMIETGKKLGTLNFAANGSNPAAAGMTFGVIGDNSMMTTMTGLRLMPIVAPTAASAVSTAIAYQGNSWRNSTGVGGTAATFTTASGQLFNDGKAGGRFVQPAVLYAAGNDIEIAATGGKIRLIKSGEN